jgi:hypothetical protein
MAGRHGAGVLQLFPLGQPAPHHPCAGLARPRVFPGRLRGAPSPHPSHGCAHCRRARGRLRARRDQHCDGDRPDLFRRRRGAHLPAARRPLPPATRPARGHQCDGAAAQPLAGHREGGGKLHDSRSAHGGAAPRHAGRDPRRGHGAGRWGGRRGKLGARPRAPDRRVAPEGGVTRRPDVRRHREPRSGAPGRGRTIR